MAILFVAHNSKRWGRDTVDLSVEPSECRKRRSAFSPTLGHLPPVPYDLACRLLANSARGFDAIPRDDRRTSGGTVALVSLGAHAGERLKDATTTMANPRYAIGDTLSQAAPFCTPVLVHP